MRDCNLEILSWDNKNRKSGITGLHLYAPMLQFATSILTLQKRDIIHLNDVKREARMYTRFHLIYVYMYVCCVYMMYVYTTRWLLYKPLTPIILTIIRTK